MREGALFDRVLPDGRELVVYPLTYGRARLVLSDDEQADFVRDSW